MDDAVKGCGALAAGFDRLEVAITLGEEVAAVLYDLEKFFDSTMIIPMAPQAIRMAQPDSTGAGHTNVHCYRGPQS